MNFSFANRLPYLDVADQVPSDSSVRTLLKSSEAATHGGGKDAVSYLNTAQVLKDLGYWRTALTYHALGIKDDSTYCLLLEQDGFARETHTILSFAKSRPNLKMGDLMVAHNPCQNVWFSVNAGDKGMRALSATSSGEKVCLYQEPSTHASSGILTALDRWFEFSFTDLKDRGKLNEIKRMSAFPLHRGGGQLDLFNGMAV